MARKGRQRLKTEATLTFSVEEAAEVLGIGRQLAYDLARTGRIPVIRLGGRYVIPRAALMRMLGETDAAPESAGAR